MQSAQYALKINTALKLNQKALCTWLPIRHLSHILRTAGGIKLKLSGQLLLLLLLLQYK